MEWRGGALTLRVACAGNTLVHNWRTVTVQYYGQSKPLELILP
jgi:hypothetical protein